MIKLTAIAIIAFAIQSPTAFAADPAQNTAKGDGKGVTTVADALEKLKREQADQPSLGLRRKVAQRFGDCLAKDHRLHGQAVTFLLSGEGSDGWQLADETCFTKAIAPYGRLVGPQIRGTFPPAVMRSLVADGLVRVDFQVQGPTDFAVVPPLDLSPVSNGASAPPKPAIADQLGECAARVSPAAIRRLAQTNVESDEEVTAIRELVPTFAQCLPPGVKLAFEPGALRDSSVLAYSRLAFTLAASGAGQRGTH
ncbi:MAG TPA: hypothetical protein VLM18_04250 [Croceibacterium sp.]|nr:hypothetical protein [Croceibacterium sp.]